MNSSIALYYRVFCALPYKVLCIREVLVEPPYCPLMELSVCTSAAILLWNVNVFRVSSILEVFGMSYTEHYGGIRCLAQYCPPYQKCNKMERATAGQKYNLHVLEQISVSTVSASSPSQTPVQNIRLSTAV